VSGSGKHFERTEMVITRGGNEELTIRQIRSLPRNTRLVQDLRHSLRLGSRFLSDLGSWIINENLTIEVQDEEDLEDVNSDTTKRLDRSAYDRYNLHHDGESKP
jgi:hypothetical protein